MGAPRFDLLNEHNFETANSIRVYELYHEHKKDIKMMVYHNLNKKLYLSIYM
jgi:hypothetical protein